MPLISITHHHTHHHYHHNPQELTKMSQQMDNLEAATARLTTVTSSVVGLLSALALQIVELKDNPAALERLAQDVNGNAERLAAAVIASDGDPTNDPGYVDPNAPPADPVADPGNQEGSEAVTDTSAGDTTVTTVETGSEAVQVDNAGDAVQTESNEAQQ